MMTKNALKFFHAYINEMIDIGGPNLPKTISTKLGSKLGKIYKERGIDNLESGLIKSFKVLKATPKIIKENNKTFKIIIKHKSGFCPIGGKYKPEKAESIQNSICLPFYLGFVNELNPKFKYSIIINECIVSSNKNYCRFTLNLELKES